MTDKSRTLWTRQLCLEAIQIIIIHILKEIKPTVFHAPLSKFVLTYFNVELVSTICNRYTHTINYYTDED